MSKATTLKQDDLDRAERRRTKLILDYRNIGVHFEEDTPLDEFPAIDQITKLRMLATKHRRPIGHLDLTDRARRQSRARPPDDARRRNPPPRLLPDHPVRAEPGTLTPAEKRHALSTPRHPRRAVRRRTVRRNRRVRLTRLLQRPGRRLPQHGRRDADPPGHRRPALLHPLPGGEEGHHGDQIPTRFDLAQELLDELIAAPSAKQAKYLSDLQRKLGLPQKPAATAEEARAELDRLIAIRNSRGPDTDRPTQTETNTMSTITTAPVLPDTRTSPKHQQGSYTLPDGTVRVIYAQRVLGHVRLTDEPEHRGDGARAYLIERCLDVGPVADGTSAVAHMNALVADYLEEANRLQRCPLERAALLTDARATRMLAPKATKPRRSRSWSSTAQPPGRTQSKPAPPPGGRRRPWQHEPPRHHQNSNARRRRARLLQLR